MKVLMTKLLANAKMEHCLKDHMTLLNTLSVS